MSALTCRLVLIASALLTTVVRGQSFVPIRVNCGGSGYTDSAGNSWAADYGFSGGNTWSTSAAIQNTTTPVLYQSERYNSGPLSYQFSVPNGSYQVRLMFAEIYWSAPNQRVFNILLNGTLVEKNFDIVVAAGGPLRAIDRTYSLTVTSGVMTILLAQVIENPKISAIQITGTGTTITLYPGNDLGAAVAAQPGGTSFLLKAGTYREQTISPKDNDVFIGETGTILSGAELLTTFGRSGNFWVVTGQTQHGPVYGQCDSAHPMCAYPEDLFVDNKVIPRATSLSSLQPGLWYFDYGAATIYLADDPTGHTVETSVTRAAFSSSAANVSISGLTVEKYASPSQIGAIGDQYPGPGWIIRNCEARWNHGGGILLSSQGQAVQNFVHDNGQKGIGGSGDNIVITGNEVSFNNYAGYVAAYEAAGVKFAKTTNLTVQGNNSHDNLGPGFWTDTDNVNTLYDGNTAANNRDNGIQHEVSYSAIIRNNICTGNGQNPGWLWQSQILIQNSQNVEVYNNTVVTTATNGNGIGIINQSRGSGSNGPYVAINNYVHNNDITYQRGSKANSGIVADYNPGLALNGSNHFDYNAYHVADTTAALWQWNVAVVWNDWHKDGQDVNGTVDTNIP